MFEMTGELVIGVVFGAGVLHAFFLIFTNVAAQNNWRLAARHFGSLFLVGAWVVVTVIYVIGTNFISKNLTSSVHVSWVFWILLMLLPATVYFVMTPKSARKRKKQK